jgi:hypothetical protein
MCYLRLLICFFLLASLQSSCKREPVAVPGQWTKDENELPCFDLHSDAIPYPWHAFPHLMSTGRACVLANQWGHVNMLISEGGLRVLYPSTQRSQGAAYPALLLNDTLYTLTFSDMTQNRSVRYGMGYAQYKGEIKNKLFHLRVWQTFTVPRDFSGNLVYSLEIENLAQASLSGNLLICSDFWPKPSEWNYPDNTIPNQWQGGKGFSAYLGPAQHLGTVYLVSDEGSEGRILKYSLQLLKNVYLDVGKTLRQQAVVGYNSTMNVRDLQKTYVHTAATSYQQYWIDFAGRLTFKADEAWIVEESVWTASQLLAFSTYDLSVDEPFVTLGGYGWFSDTDNPDIGGGFNSREVAEVVMPLAYIDTAMAKSCMRWHFKLQNTNGQPATGYDYVPGHLPNYSHRTSDNALWLLLACSEYIKVTGDETFLDEKTPFYNGSTETAWEHIRRAFAWVEREETGGSHGLLRMLDGDWNDCLNKIGKQGRGESVMNTGIACRAFDQLYPIAKQRKDTAFARRLKHLSASLHTAMDKTFDQEWFIRAYNDQGEPVGTRLEDRLFLNAQSWAVLGKCGTSEQRRAALQSALKLCGTDIGAMLMSKPFGCPAPPEITDYSNPAGEGENCGIWPQTVYWFIWALAEEGMWDEARDQWKKMSLRNHFARYPQVPFGVINGPDCYSSRLSSQREGWTQMRNWNRNIATPMNPMVAWQYFAWQKIQLTR